jgi:hypothetical protein
MYGSALAVQDTPTGFGDSSLGRPDFANGSELDAAYGVIYNGVLYLCFTGNLETNGNDLEIFINSRAGGQNRLVYENPGAPNVGVLRMSASDPNNTDGLKFTAGYGADFWVSANAFGDPAAVYVDYAELYVDSNNLGAAYYCGSAATTCGNADGTLSGGDTGAPAIKANVDNRNVLGVPGTGGGGGDDPALVKTGIELAIPLSAIGNPTGPVDITVFINGQQHDFISNQFLWGLFGNTANIGEPRAADLSQTAHFPITVPAAGPALGSCCVGTSCSITTQAGCSGTWTINGSCDSNPCDGVPGGRCCIADDYSGRCEVMTLAECNAFLGQWTEGENCDGCPCLLAPKGACCVGTNCLIVSSADCAAQSGSYLGDFTNCNNTPCAEGACCDGTDCSVVRQFECVFPMNYIGDGTTCANNPCAGATIPTPYIAGSFQGWNPTSTPMTPAGTNKWTYAVTGQTPNSRQPFKITNGLDWGDPNHRNLPSANSWAYTDANGAVTITYDGNFYNDGWLPQRDRIGLDVDPAPWGIPGDYLTEIGAPGNWNNAEPLTQMVLQGDGTYLKEYTGISPGTYAFKPTKFGTWDSLNFDTRSENTGNWSVTITAETDVWKIYLDNARGCVKQEVISAPEFCLGDADCSGEVDFFDIDPYVARLGCPSSDPVGCNTGCPWQNCDVDEDGDVDFFDIDPFVGTLGNICP